MKKLLFSIILTAYSVLGFSQIFQENFDGNGPGIDAWTVIDVDGNTPNSSAWFIKNGWDAIYRDGVNGNFGGPRGNRTAMSTSMYYPVGKSNDWLISPKIDLSGSTIKLVWRAKTQDGNLRDGYKLMLSSNGGNTVADFDVELFSIGEEVSKWKERNVDLSSYSGTSIRFAFVNDSEAKSFLMVDDILVTNNYSPIPTPECPIISSPSSGATDVEYFDGVKFSWTAPQGDVSDYDFYLNGELFVTTKNPEVTVDDLKANTTYRWKVIANNPTGDSSECTEYSFTTKVSPVHPYCGPMAFGTYVGGIFAKYVEPISLVQFAGINNSTNADVDASPSHEAFLDKFAEVKQGEKYDIVVKGSTNGNYQSHVAVFLDWNMDGEFGESETYHLPVLENSTGLDNKESKFSIEVPQDAKEGVTRMRVKKTSVRVNLKDPCNGTYVGKTNFGQAEEYSVRVVNKLGVSESIKSNLNVYPNPVKDILNIHSDSKINTIVIYDSSGQIMNDNLDINKSQINFSKLIPGSYILKITTENGKSQSIKVIKK